MALMIHSDSGCWIRDRDSRPRMNANRFQSHAISRRMLFVVPALLLTLVSSPVSSANSASSQATHGHALRQAAAPTIRGVNLGGWLVLEPWIVPSLFQQFVNATTKAVDEYTFSLVLGRNEASRQLTAHWDTWVTEQDISDLAEYGINHVRIPIGYWILSHQDDEPWIDGGDKFLDRALGWCRQYSIQVLLDLHGAPGSQNGFDNSGVRGSVHWADKNTTHLIRTLDVMSQLVQRYGADAWTDVVVAIELVNEPLGSVDLTFVQNYYMSGYQLIRSGANNQNLLVVLHDSFRFNSWSGFMQPPNYQNVILDTHIYQAFDMAILMMNESQHLSLTCSQKPAIAKSNNNLWTLVGEWSLASTDCAVWLNGFGNGSRYDGSFFPYMRLGSCDGRNNASSYTPEYRAFLRSFAELQMDAYEAGVGWFFWNFKTEASPTWNYLLGVKQGWIPKSPNDRTQKC